MAVLAAILPVVSRSSSLSLELYQFAALSPKEAKDSLEVARAINNFASILKQVGTIIKEDDRLPSYEVRPFPYASYAITLPSRRVDQAGKTKCLFNYIRLSNMKDVEKYAQYSRRMIQKWVVDQTVARTFCRLGLIRLIGSRCTGRRDGAISDCVERDRAYD